MAITGQCIYKNNSGYTHNEAFSSSDTTQTINGMKFQMSWKYLWHYFTIWITT